MLNRLKSVLLLGFRLEKYKIFYIMNLCTSCKKQGSDERCNKNCIKGLDVCGIHAKSKKQRNWYEVNNLSLKISKIQAVWRGFKTRCILDLAGPGVLKRSICHNEEELVSLDPISKIHPFSYFSFEEDGKIWAFDIKSIFKILLYNVTIQNPYTRSIISNENKRRLRNYFFYTMRMNICPTHIPQSDLILCRLNLITQIIQDNGFEDFKPEYLSSLSQEQAYIMRSLLLYDIRILGNNQENLRLLRYCSLLNSRTFMVSSHPRVILITILSLILTDICHMPKEEYEVCFLIMSALYRV